MKRIKFTKYGSTNVLGNFEPGTIARCDDAFAKHLVEELRVATYLDAPPVPPVVKAPEPEPVAAEPVAKAHTAPRKGRR